MDSVVRDDIDDEIESFCWVESSEELLQNPQNCSQEAIQIAEEQHVDLPASKTAQESYDFGAGQVDTGTPTITEESCLTRENEQTNEPSVSCDVIDPSTTVYSETISPTLADCGAQSSLPSQDQPSSELPIIRIPPPEPASSSSPSRSQRFSPSQPPLPPEIFIYGQKVSVVNDYKGRKNYQPTASLPTDTATVGYAPSTRPPRVLHRRMRAYRRASAQSAPIAESNSANTLHARLRKLLRDLVGDATLLVAVGMASVLLLLLVYVLLVAVATAVGLVASALSWSVAAAVVIMCTAVVKNPDYGTFVQWLRRLDGPAGERKNENAHTIDGNEDNSTVGARKYTWRRTNYGVVSVVRAEDGDALFVGFWGRWWRVR